MWQGGCRWKHAYPACVVLDDKGVFEVGAGELDPRVLAVRLAGRRYESEVGVALHAGLQAEAHLRGFLHFVVEELQESGR